MIESRKLQSDLWDEERNMSMVVLYSKTTVPTLPHIVVSRERVIKLLRADQSKKAFIVSAPAGYGKTTLLSDALKNVDGSIAWVSIDALDNDTTSYLKYLLHSIQKALAHIENISFEHLHAFSPQKPIELLIDLLLNELSSVPTKVHIVLEDFHEIENAIIHKIVQRLIEYLPLNCFVYIASRTAVPLPLARWRLKGWIKEIGIEELRFTMEELEEFQEKTALLPSDAKLLERIMASTEGWIAGIHLASLSGEQGLLQEDRGIRLQPNLSFVKDFIVDELLNGLSEELQQFLLQTSIVDRLDPEICEAITGNKNSVEILDLIERKGLFLLRVNSTYTIYRYHRLFAEALRCELYRTYSQAKISELHVKAAFFMKEYADDMRSAIEVLMDGQQYTLAEKWIYENLVHFFRKNQTESLIRWVVKLVNENIYLHVETRVMYAFLLALNHQIREAMVVLDGMLAQHKRDDWMNEPSLYSVVRAYASVRSYCYVANGENLESAYELIKQKIDSGLISSRWDYTYVCYNQFEPKILRTSIGSRGKLWNEHLMLKFFNLFRKSDFNKENMTSFTYGIRAETLYEWNRIEDTLPEIEGAIREGYKFNDPGLYIPMYILKSRISIANEDFVSAQSTLDYALAEVTEWYWQRSLYAMKAYCALVQGEVETAEKYLYTVRAPKEMSTELGQSLWLLVKARLLLARQQQEEALRIVVAVQTKALQEDQITTWLEATVLKAACHDALQNEKMALRTLHEAIKLGQTYQYKRTFIDEWTVAPLLNRYYKQLDKKENEQFAVYVEKLRTEQFTKPLVNLTDREVEVLNLLVRGLANRQIAEQLNLKESTIRVYLTTIYQKLNVDTRAQAIIKCTGFL